MFISSPQVIFNLTTSLPLSFFIFVFLANQKITPSNNHSEATGNSYLQLSMLYWMVLWLSLYLPSPARR
jgi:hypothetical protein